MSPTNQEQIMPSEEVEILITHFEYEIHLSGLLNGQVPQRAVRCPEGLLGLGRKGQ